jgi:isopenicillin-N N-acyltransferase like protein
MVAREDRYLRTTVTEYFFNSKPIMPKLRLLELSGSYYEIGYAHGRAYADDIRRYTAERVELAGAAGWTGHELSRQEVLSLAEACVAEHQAYAPDLVEELQGMADATGLSLAELVITNGFTDFVDTVYTYARQKVATLQAADDCTAFIVPNRLAADGHGLFGQSWDMHASSTEFVILLRCRPTDAPSCLTFTITGCVGMIGMNDAGIVVGINNLLGGDGQIGVTWPFVVRKALQQTHIEDALRCITEAKLAGAHNYILFDKHSNGYNVEATSTATAVTRLDGDALVHTNHCLFDETGARCRPRTAASQASTEARLARAQTLLARDQITPECLMELTRDKTICVRAAPPLHIESCGAAIMRPSTGDFWAVWGLPAKSHYEHFHL